MLISKFGTISKNVISEYEDIHEIKLPEQYRLFLEKNNGGETPNSSININGVSSDLRGMCGIGKVKFSLDAVCAEEIHGTSYLAIGVDSFGNDILINLSELYE